MSRETRLALWLAVFALFIVAVWALRSILPPFVVGMAVAYFFDPLADRLQRLGLSRLWATLVITLIFFLIAPVIIGLLAPIIGDQVASFAQRIPSYVQSLAHSGDPIWNALKKSLSPKDIEQIRSAATDYAGTIAGWAGGFAKDLVGSGLAVANALSLLFITPFVTFYLLRDWHRVTAAIDGWLPPRHADVIRQQLREINHILAGFVRGQALVCLTLAVIYGVGLTVVGLDLGLLVGIGAGFLSFIPYVGSITGFFISIALAAGQGQGWTLPAEVAAVYAVGNQIEANFLAPRLVGSKIGLHPVWVIFALLAGGALFGFVGLMLALPVAAVVGVLARFAIARYLDSPLYSGDFSDDPPPAPGP
ncbi:MAG TPA: AI-2E family transporter [Magnetospirillaceae bacterium]|jgi:predicted PurR-regulated permease PerM